LLFAYGGQEHAPCPQDFLTIRAGDDGMSHDLPIEATAFHARFAFIWF